MLLSAPLSPPPSGKRRRVDVSQFLDISAQQAESDEEELEDKDDPMGKLVV